MSKQSRNGMSGKSGALGKTGKSAASGRNGKVQARATLSAGPIAFFVALFIVALGTIQLVATFHTYALNLAELNGLKREEASLIAKKQDLENDIKRWNDKAYITAQARERLGFVFPGEQAVRVLHPEAVTGGQNTDGDSSSSSETDKKVLPWYKELAYAFQQADQPVNDTSGKESSGTTSSDDHKSSSSNDSGDQSSQDGQDDTDHNTEQQNTDQNTGEDTQQ
ncbi:FtsB family cell division protein [Bifidobacterium olomucense]|uniref:Septum formation initiator n=1 Tax=Bifidobacterium olomucense TaxID=2675324 RepID=A0A7Y0EXK5_9BIFI|nr:septum formation initiator family protein [Bifidobacterium sp. DSM 109959]NMM98270.1 septum formation initiator [Bifidobacterium sp. DSM 109959]